MIKTLTKAYEYGKISVSNTKMPGSSFATDPFQCKTGSKLAKVEGTVCSRCYARRIVNFRPSVKKGYERNSVKVRIADKDDWIEGMTYQIGKAYAKTGEPYHRWFDAGDLDSKRTLSMIIEVAKCTPDIQHWLPTKEASIVKAVLKEEERPSNLTIRLSGTRVDGNVPKTLANTSTVHTKGEEYTGFECPAFKQKNKCDKCRACWNGGISNISYPLH